MMRQETFRPVLERLLATRRAKVEDTQSGARRGMRVLFTGPSGKNRLLAAQLFAHELSVDLYQIDLDRIVSKSWATRRRISTRCSRLPKPRTPCCCSTTPITCLPMPSSEESGRFPNLNVAQLRQRIEAYDGVVLLCADDRTHIDPKFARQCDEVVELSDD